MSETTDVIIIGCGGAARDLVWLFEECNQESNRWNVLGFIDNEPSLVGQTVLGLPVLGGDDWLEQQTSPSSTRLFCGIGAPRKRKQVAERFSRLGYRFCSVVDPRVRMSRSAKFGEGTAITAGNILTTNVTVGSHVLLNLGCIVNHDVTIADYCLIGPGTQISGAVSIGEGADIGTGTSIIQGVTVGSWSIVGAGSVVVSDIPANVTAVGVPCRVIKSHS